MQQHKFSGGTFWFKNVLVELINKNKDDKIIDSSIYMSDLLPQIISKVAHILNTPQDATNTEDANLFGHGI